MDVGLRIRAGEAPFSWLRIAVPFDCQDGVAPIDLSRFVLDPGFAPLIFGKPTDVSHGRITYDDPSDGRNKLSLDVMKLELRSCKQESLNRKKNGFSTWQIWLDRKISPGQEGYFRFRLPVKSAHRFWIDQGWGLAKKGNIFDIRIADVRESVFLDEGKDELEDIVPIERMFLFAGVTANNVPRLTSPNLYYSRALEPAVWKNYLAGIGRYIPSHRIVIHQWRNQRNGNFSQISVDNPFRVYMDSSREFGSQLLVLYVTALSVPYLINAGKTLYHFVRGLVVPLLALP
jgi:hypothetical protein